MALAQPGGESARPGNRPGPLETPVPKVDPGRRYRHGYRPAFAGAQAGGVGARLERRLRPPPPCRSFALCVTCCGAPGSKSPCAPTSHPAPRSARCSRSSLR
eukprot:scaffold23875_cov90-Isochrysis_galbana.AAC.2